MEIIINEAKKDKKYQKVILSIISDIEHGKLKPNQALPSEHDLAEIFNVSRITIRKALNELFLTNFVTKSQGQRTLVNNRIVDKKLNEMVSFTQSSLLRNENPSTRVLFLQCIDPTAYVAKHLHIDLSDKVWYIKRIRYTNGFPLIYEESYWVKKIVGIITQQHAEDSMIAHIKSLGIFPKEAKQDLDSVIANEKLAKVLDVHIGYPLLRSTMVIMDQNKAPFQISFNYHRTDRIKLSLTRQLNE